jgi:glycosyltransferase involved in cell wall biosynthesis
VAEALAAGVPTLISNKVNIWREVEVDGAGMVSQDTLPGLCGLLQSYVDMPAEKRLAMRHAAVQCFEQRFEIRQAAQTLYSVLVGAVTAS